MVEILLGKFNKSFFIKKIGRRRPAGFDRKLKLNFKNHSFSHFFTDFGDIFSVFRQLRTSAPSLVVNEIVFADFFKTLQFFLPGFLNIL